MTDALNAAGAAGWCHTDYLAAGMQLSAGRDSRASPGSSASSAAAEVPGIGYVGSTGSRFAT